MMQRIPLMLKTSSLELVGFAPNVLVDEYSGIFVPQVSPVELMEVVVVMRRIDNTWEHVERITTHASRETQTSSHGH